VAPLAAAAVAALAPGMCADALAAAAAGTGGAGAALLVQGGLVVHPARYLRCGLLVPCQIAWAVSRRRASIAQRLLCTCTPATSMYAIMSKRMAAATIAL
jgi:hypothetical protein